MKARVVNKSIISVFIAMILLTALFPANVYASSSVVTLTFGDEEIEETVTGNGYKIDGTTLNITESGVYIITGSCAEGSISVNKNLDGVILILENLSLSSSVTAPLVVKKNSNVTVHTNGSVELYDLEDASTEETNSDFEGAAIKVKSGSTVTFCGEGTLNIYGNAKNGIKGASTANLVFNEGQYNISAENNALASDGSIKKCRYKRRRRCKQYRSFAYQKNADELKLAV